MKGAFCRVYFLRVKWKIMIVGGLYCNTPLFLMSLVKISLAKAGKGFTVFYVNGIRTKNNFNSFKGVCY